MCDTLPCLSCQSVTDGGVSLASLPCPTLLSPAAAALKAMVGGKERTRQQWHDLMHQAGFTIQSISQAPSMAAIVAVPDS